MIGLGPGRGPKPPKKKAEGRICAACETRLSVYNPGLFCSLHQGAQLNRFRVPSKRRS